jgi:type II pantothenate kinase
MNHDLQKIFDSIEKPENIKKIFVTGGKSSDLPKTLNGLPVSHKNEIDSIALGAKQLYDLKESALIVSTGTGTACVHFDGVNGNHLGGIAVGGGMLCGLGSLLLRNDNALEIDEFAEKGDKSKIDFLIGDVVNKIGNLSPEITATNFGKVVNSEFATMENVAASLCNMIGEVIGTIAYLNAFLLEVDKVYFIGRTALLKNVQAGIGERLQLAGIKGVYAENCEYANALGCIEN